MQARKKIALALLALLLAFGLMRAIQLAWSCDDAFISYRYADNLVDGLGLVYNAGERVEGYTNPLWTLSLAAFRALGVAPTASSTWLGVVAYAALAAILAGQSLARSRATGRPFVPLAAALVLAMPDFHVWATGGLETMLYTLLATAGLLATRGQPSLARATGAGVLLALTVFTRPDGALFALVGVVSPWIAPAARTPSRKLRLSFAIGLPVLVLNGLHLAWKLAYYGEPLPTAFYSKSAVDPYFSQGLFYLWLLVKRNWFLAPALVLALIAVVRPSARGAREPWDVPVFAGSAALFLVYVAYTGGDFMYARRAIPALPLLFVAVEALLLRLESRHALALTAALTVAALLPLSIYGPETWEMRGVADERHHYVGGYHDRRREQAERVGEIFADTPVRATFHGGMCSFGYYSRLPYLAELTGLTQMSLARSPLAERGYIGHEKSPTPEWFIENGIHLMFSKADEKPPEGERMFNEIYIGERTGALVLLYDDAVMDALRGRDDVFFVPIEDVLANLGQAVRNAPLDQAERSFAMLSQYYFRSGGPRALAAEAELRKVLERRRPAGSPR